MLIVIESCAIYRIKMEQRTAFLILLLAICCAIEFRKAKGVQECTSGFPDPFGRSPPGIRNAAFTFKEEKSSITTRIIPEMKFTCYGTLRTLIFGGRVRNNTNCQIPVLQTWRKISESNNTYRVVHPNMTCVNGTIQHQNLLTKFDNQFSVFNCTLVSTDNNLQVDVEDILGVFLPPSNEAFFSFIFTSGSSSDLKIPTNYVFYTQQTDNGTIVLGDNNTTDQALPLVYFDVEPDCTRGFLTEDDIICQEFDEKMFLVRGSPTIRTTRIIPEMMFTCSGRILTITFAADILTGMNSFPVPVLQVWRKTGTMLHNAELVHQNVRCLPGTFVQIEEKKFTCNLENLRVKPGDMLGIVFPDANQARLHFYFVNQSSEIAIPTNYIFNATQVDNNVIALGDNIYTENSLPLISLQLFQDEAQPVSPPTSTDSSTTITTGNDSVTDNNRSGSDTGKTIRVIVLSTVGLIVAVLLVVLIVLLVIFMRRTEKGFSLLKTHDCHSSKQHGKTTQQVLTNRNSYCADNVASHGVTGEYESMFSYQDIDTSYPARPVHTTETHNQTSFQQKFPNQEDALCLSYPHYEQQTYYVPSGEQRRLKVSVQCNYAVEDNEASMNVQPFPVFFEESDSFWEPSSNPDELYYQLHAKKYREILTSQIQISTHDQLGIGNFGTVHKGIWQSSMGAMDVAVKTLHSGAKEEEKVKFLQEAAINGQFRHPNVVQLMGVVTVEEPVMIVLELLSNGDLHNYLIKQRPNSMEKSSFHIVPSTLLKFCQQTASGMEYLSKKGFVHRDLAARNILVAEDKTCKISDFGMCRDLVDDDYYVSHGGEVPVKWTAPEAIYYKRYSTASDVWSFGCVMYEIWSLGHKPFEAYSNREAATMIEKGYRLPPPPGCSKELYRIMIQCWNPKTDCRPSFDSLLEMLCKPEYELFMWKENDSSESRVVGAPLAFGQNLYPTLQTVYLDRN